jgi:hypothetical protein
MYFIYLQYVKCAKEIILRNFLLRNKNSQVIVRLVIDHDRTHNKKMKNKNNVQSYKERM